jgi:hypothetical protein
MMLVLVGCTPAATTVNQASYAVEESYVVLAHTELTVLPTLSPVDQAAVRQFDASAYAAVVQLRQATQNGQATSAEIDTAKQAVQMLSQALHQ